MAGVATSLVNVRVGLGWATGEEGRSVRAFNPSTLSDLPSRAGSIDESA